MNRNSEIKVFGEKADSINEGDEFIAKVGSVEGHTVVTLVPKENQNDD